MSKKTIDTMKSSHDNDLVSDDNINPMLMLPEKLDNEIPFFREKPVKIISDGYVIFFREINGLEYWIMEEKDGAFYKVQWIEIDRNKPKKFHRKISSRYGLDIKNRRRDNELVKYLHEKTGIEKKEIEDYLEEAGLFIADNQIIILNQEKNNDKEDSDVISPISDKKRKQLIDILKRPDLLSYIDQAFYERSPSDGFIIGEIESKHILNFNCIGARLGISTINTLKGASSIGKTNTANVVTGLHRVKKVGSLSDTALKYSEDLDQVDILYIQETLEDEFKSKETRLMSGDDGGFLAETTIKNPKTGKFEVQQNIIPVKTIVTTTTAIELDPEFASRNFILPVDDSEEQTRRILEENFKSTEKKLQEIKGEVNFNHKYDILKEAFRLLEPYIVFIPYENALLEIFPTSHPRARRDSKKLMQLIKESALMFQYQRCRSQLNGLPVLVASWMDLAHAILLGGPILEATITGFDKRLIEALPKVHGIIEEDGYVTTKSLQQKLKKSSKYSWKILNFFEDNGYIFHDPATKQVEGIKGKIKVYLKSDSKQYMSLFLASRNINWLNIKNMEEKFIKQQIPNSSHNVGDDLHLPYYDVNVPNKFVYKSTPINSEEFGIYTKNENEQLKSINSDRENLLEEKRNLNSSKIIKSPTSMEIDYRSLNQIEIAIMAELASLKKHTMKSIVEELKSKFSEKDLISTLKEMEEKEWI